MTWQPRQISARFDSDCPKCGRRIRAGAPIYGYSQGWICETCHVALGQVRQERVERARKKSTRRGKNRKFPSPPLAEEEALMGSTDESALMRFVNKYGRLPRLRHL